MTEFGYFKVFYLDTEMLDSEMMTSYLDSSISSKPILFQLSKEPSQKIILVKKEH